MRLSKAPALLLCLATAYALDAFARDSTAIFPPQTKLFPVPSGQCGLQRFTVGTAGYSSRDSFGARNESYAGGMIAVYETSDASCSRRYAVAQWVRGCVYSGAYDRRTGAVQNYDGVSRKSRGKSIKFRHKTWEIDAMEEDPMYWGAPAADAFDPERFHSQRVPKQPLLWKSEAQIGAMLERYGNSNDIALNRSEVPESRTRQQFVKDMPTGASWDLNPYNQNLESSTNVSLEFQTCVYRIEDLPLVGDPARFDAVPDSPGAPLACFPWSVKKRWNFAEKKFETEAGMDAYCGVTD